MVAILEQRLSIIVPVYRDSNGLMETLTSLLPQIPEEEGVQIIVSNDGAHSEIRQILEKFKDRRIQYVELPKRQGSYAARNKAIQQAHGKWLAFLDAGVSVEDSWYASLMLLINKQVDYIAGDVLVPVEWAKSDAERYNASVSFPIAHYLKTYKFGVTANLAVRRSVIEEVGRFDERLRSGGDLEFGDRVARHGFKQIFSENLLVKHTPRNLSQMKSKTIRVHKGLSDLIRYYPERYAQHRSQLGFLPVIYRTIKQLVWGIIYKGYVPIGISIYPFVKIIVVLAFYKLHANWAIRINDEAYLNRYY